MTTVSKSEETKFVDLKICPEIITLYYLAKITKIDILTLTLLFEKLGTGIYYLFYMLAKRKISFPSESNLLKAIKFSEVVEQLDSNFVNINKVPQKDREIFQSLINSVVDRKYIRVKIDSVVTNSSSDSTVTPRVIVPVIKSELNSSIKKYIRKEKRKLDKIGQMYSLFDSESKARENLINKIYDIFITKISSDDKIEDLKGYISTLIDSYNK